MRALYIFVFLILSQIVLSQTGIVRGSVIDGESGQPVIYTNVYLKGTSYGGVTDVDGFFIINKIPVGSYSLMVSCIGYDTLVRSVLVEPNRIITEKLILKKAAYELKGAVINAERQSSQIETKTSLMKITTKEIKQLPTIGQADIAQYLQVVPGVVFTGDQGGQLYIRGGTPVQNLVLLDGLTVYNPFHSVGLFSVFDADIIRNADVYTGGFGAEYGGRISSVMDITTRYGNPKRLAGKVDFSTFGAKALLEGPLLKSKNQNDGSISYLLSLKNSYIDKTSKSLYPYVNKGDGLPFTFTDLYGKLTFLNSKGSKADIFGFNFSDDVTYQSINNYNWNNFGGGVKFVVVPEGSTILFDGNFSYSKYAIALDDGGYKERKSAVDGFNMGLNFTYFFGKNKLKYGLEMKGFSTDYVFYNSINREITQKENTTEIAAYVTTKFLLGKNKSKFKNENDEQIAKFIISPGFRAHYYATLQNLSPEPRLSIKYNVSRSFRLKLATGLYSQNLISTASDRDVVNLFYGFISGPDNLQKSFDGKEITQKLQKATHLIIGGELDLFSHISVNLEGYYKWFTQLTNLNRNKVFDDNEHYLDRPDVLKKDFIIEKGDAYGVDISVKYDYKNFYFWTVYSLGYSHRFDGITEYIPHFDRRHNVNLVGTYDFGKDKTWQVSLRWNYGSGFPFTPTLGNYELLTFEDGIGTDYTQTNGSVGIVYGTINSKRLPDYHRLDFGFSKKILISENSVFEINFSITNLYNRANIFYIDRITNKRIDQLPLMPSLGINFSF